MDTTTTEEMQSDRTLNIMVCYHSMANGKFDDESVPSLYENIKAYANKPFNFYAISERMWKEYPEIKCWNLFYPHSKDRYWIKMELFRPDIPINEFFYLDLDTRIVGNIDWWWELDKPYMIKELNSSGKLESGLMYITPQVKKIIWNSYISDMQYLRKKHRRDGILIRTLYPDMYAIQDDYPGELKSYKINKPTLEDPRCSVVCFHGQPFMQDVGWRYGQSNISGEGGTT